MKETHKQKIDRQRGAAADRAFDPIRAAIDCGDLVITPGAIHRDDVGDYVCQHGTAMDVHCCGCHSGFIFDLEHECEPELMRRCLRGRCLGEDCPIHGGPNPEGSR